MKIISLPFVETDRKSILKLKCNSQHQWLMSVILVKRKIALKQGCKTW
jgi:hypothetical protein